MVYGKKEKSRVDLWLRLQVDYHSTTGNAGDSVYRSVEENEFNFRYIMGWGVFS